MKMSFIDRAKTCKNPVAKSLFTIMQEKQSMLSLSADIEDKQTFLELVDQVGPTICLLKTHIDAIEAVDQQFIQDMQALAEKHRFLIFEDRKFADIGNTVKKQYGAGTFRIADWAHIVNAHVLPGPGIIEGLKAVGQPKGRALLLLAQMSSQGNLLDAQYTKQTVQFAKEHADFVIGFIALKRLIDDPSFIHMTPGVKLEAGTDPLGQQYLTPESVVNAGADIIIVGRGITTAKDPLATAKRYQDRAWQAYHQHVR